MTQTVPRDWASRPACRPCQSDRLFAAFCDRGLHLRLQVYLKDARLSKEAEGLMKEHSHQVDDAKVISGPTNCAVDLALVVKLIGEEMIDDNDPVRWNVLEDDEHV